MQSFLGFVNFYGDYISDATELTAPLYKLTAARKADESIKLTAENLELFEKLSVDSVQPPDSRPRATVCPLHRRIENRGRRRATAT